MSKNNICVINYQLNNISSVIKALHESSIKFEVLNEGTNLYNFSHVIIPGIGSFGAGVSKLKDLNFFDKLKNCPKNIKILGICLGMQILFETSEESNDPNTKGLSLIKGNVKKMTQFNNKNIYIPHIGWNKIEKLSNLNHFEIDTRSDFYFANSYYVNPKKKDVIKFVFLHGKKYPAVIQEDNYVGFQFHPEKSKTGIEILKSFCI